MGEFLNSALGLLFTSFASIIAISNPFGTMAIFASLTDDKTSAERKKIAQRATMYMFIILTIFLLAGTSIKNFFGISMAGIRVAGGLILLQSAFSMMKPGTTPKRITKEGENYAMEQDDISFSPLAMPMLSGPGSIAAVIGLASNRTDTLDFVVMIIAVFLTALVAYFVLRLGPLSSKYIGPTGMNAITRMMGFIVMAMAVQFILTGVQDFFGL